MTESGVLIKLNPLEVHNNAQHKHYLNLSQINVKLRFFSEVSNFKALPKVLRNDLAVNCS